MSPVCSCLWISTCSRHRSLAAEELRAALMSKGKTIPNYQWRILAECCPSVQCFRLSTFQFKWEPECCMAKLTQSATSTASTCPVAALLLMGNTWKGRSVVPVALGISICRALTKNTWRLSHSSNNYLPLHPGLGKEDVSGFLLSI